jgi:transcriptional regulator with XRE-family HTH domain
VLRKRPSKKTADMTTRGRRGVLTLAASNGETVLPQEADGVAEPPSGPIDPLHGHETLGAALKAVRHDKGLTLEEVAEITRVRRAYLEAIEEMRLEELPSRPFTIGYIRAYATALGLDPEVATERFKTEEPVLDEPLRAPVGVPDEKDPRVAAFLIGALVIVIAIVLWNVAQRAMMAGGPPPPLAPQDFASKALSQMKSGPVELGTPLPAPVESTTPPPYETPGLAEALGLKTDTAAQANHPKPANELGAVDLASLPKVFVPAGKIYDLGNPQLSSVVTIQALKPASLIVRGPDGSVYFARQLAKGEAFKAPQLAGLTLDVSNANDFQVFVYGQSKGVLPAPQVLASKLVTNPDPATVAPAAVARPPAASTPTPKPPAP